MGHKVGRPHEARVKLALKHATEANKRAAAVYNDELVNRSTRIRRAYKIKANALDLITLVLKDER